MWGEAWRGWRSEPVLRVDAGAGIVAVALGTDRALGTGMTKHTRSANDLWETAHYALCQARWADARRALDALALRTDSCQLFCEPGSYGEPAHIRDRIAACNAAADRAFAADTIDRPWWDTRTT